MPEALALTEGDFDPARGSLLVRREGGRRREVGMDAWGWEQLDPWLELRRALPVGPLSCLITGAPRGRSWSPTAASAELRRTAAVAGVRRRFAPHQLRDAHAVEMTREGVPLIVIQRQLGHSNLGMTSVYLQGIDRGEIIEAVHPRGAPMISVSASLRTERPPDGALLVAQSASADKGPTQPRSLSAAATRTLRLWAWLILST